MRGVKSGDQERGNWIDVGVRSQDNCRRDLFWYLEMECAVIILWVNKSGELVSQFWFPINHNNSKRFKIRIIG